MQAAGQSFDAAPLVKSFGQVLEDMDRERAVQPLIGLENDLWL